MREFKKSKVYLHFNIFFIVLFIMLGGISLLKLGKTTDFMGGIDLYLIIALIFFAFSIPFIINLIRYLFTPKVILKIYRDEFLIYSYKKEQYIHASRLLGVSKYNNTLAEFFKFDVGHIKLLLRDQELPLYIRFLEDLDAVYQTFNIVILKNFEKSRLRK